jgi:hypothetical protein
MESKVTSFRPLPDHFWTPLLDQSQLRRFHIECQCLNVREFSSNPQRKSIQMIRLGFLNIPAKPSAVKWKDVQNNDILLFLWFTPGKVCFQKERLNKKLSCGSGVRNVSDLSQNSTVPLKNRSTGSQKPRPLLEIEKDAWSHDRFPSAPGFTLAIA